METICPECGHKFEASYDDDRCPKCGAEFFWDEMCTEDYSDCWDVITWHTKTSPYKAPTTRPAQTTGLYDEPPWIIICVLLGLIPILLGVLFLLGQD